MKLLRTLSLLLFIFSFGLLSGQATLTYNDYVQGSISQLKMQFQRSGYEGKLSDAQILKLEKIFAEKEVKFKSIKTKYTDKGDLGEAFANLDKEYNPKIESVLDDEQKLAFRKVTQKKDTSSK